ncbi:GNAT family N-acetyltransferase [Planctomicrobium sp. SH668]|uniref:GNAT family N-acetyltransferase n=1 Tax=Planctomicrobium sp. SH668 TaxID=3448126 RepID=UPI003F5B675A
MAVFGLPYFDPNGLIIAEQDGQIIGYVHAGFGFTDDRSGLDHSVGIICCIMVETSQQQKGTGRELVARAEAYLAQHGAKRIQVGQSRGRDPFYFGIYGGARPSGFMESNPSVGTFFQSLGYLPIQTIPIFQRDLSDRKDPMNIRLMTIRRQTELRVSDQPDHPTWWWYTRFGNIESMLFQLVDRKTSSPVAAMTVVGLDHYIRSWNERAIGLVDIYVEPAYRGQGYGQALVVETIRRLRTEMITRAEIHIPQDFPDAMGAILSSGFKQVDTGIVYAKPS